MLFGMTEAQQEYFYRFAGSWMAAFNRAEGRGNDAMVYCAEHNAAASALDRR